VSDKRSNEPDTLVPDPLVRAEFGVTEMTPRYQVEDVFGPLWRARERLRPRNQDRLREYLDRLSPFHGMGGGFMPGQIIADLKYVEPLHSAADWWSFAVSGPGSRRGLNRVLGRSVKSAWDEDDWRREMRRLHEDIESDLKRIGIGRIHRQDLNNILCEYDKYERTRLGEGKPKRRFTPRDLPRSSRSIEASSRTAAAATQQAWNEH